MSIRTATHLQDALDKDFAWRIQEIAALRSSLRSASGNQKRVFLRAGVALLYAHWEGFIKTAGNAYLEFVSHQNVPFSQLQSCFTVLALKSDIDTLGEAKSILLNLSILDRIRTLQTEVVSAFG